MAGILSLAAHAPSFALSKLMSKRHLPCHFTISIIIKEDRKYHRQHLRLYCLAQEFRERNRHWKWITRPVTHQWIRIVSCFPKYEEAFPGIEEQWWLLLLHKYFWYQAISQHTSTPNLWSLPAAAHPPCCEFSLRAWGSRPMCSVVSRPKSHQQGSPLWPLSNCAATS